MAAIAFRAMFDAPPNALAMSASRTMPVFVGRGKKLSTSARPQWPRRSAPTRFAPEGDKIMRLHGQTATIENGFVRLPEAAPPGSPTASPS